MKVKHLSPFWSDNYLEEWKWMQKNNMQENAWDEWDVSIVAVLKISSS